MTKKTFNLRLLSSLILFVLASYLVLYDQYIFNLFLIILLLISIFEWIKFNINILLTFFGFFFLLISFYVIFIFKNFDTPLSNFYFILTLIICISSDVGGYITGNIIGGPKLTKISPNKTYSGVFGAFILSIISSYVYVYYFKLENILLNNFILLVLIISLTSQIGDLIISYFKRLAKIKDTGNLIPGHGGVLDRIDGMLFALPFTFLFII